jgi:hypothetical protein
MVRSVLVTACLFAASPTKRSPCFENATTLGVVILPVPDGIMTGLLFSTTDTQLFVVPRSIPITLLICLEPPFYQNLLLNTQKTIPDWLALVSVQMG